MPGFHPQAVRPNEHRTNGPLLSPRQSRCKRGGKPRPQPRFRHVYRVAIPTMITGVPFPKVSENQQNEGQTLIFADFSKLFGTRRKLQNNLAGTAEYGVREYNGGHFSPHVSHRYIDRVGANIIPPPYQPFRSLFRQPSPMLERPLPSGNPRSPLQPAHKKHPAPWVPG